MTSHRLAMCVVALLACSCGRQGVTDDRKGGAASDRLISLSPAVTALLQDLSLERRLVGRSAFCRGVDAVPVVGDLGGVDVEAVIRLQPHVLLYQATAAPPPSGLSEAAQAAGARVVAVAVDDIDDLHVAVDAIVYAMDPAGIDETLLKAATAAHDSLHAATRPAQSRQDGVRVLLVQPGASMLAWGGKTWLGRVVAAAGAQPLLGGRAWATVSAEDVVRLAPDVIFVLGESVDVDPGALATLPTPAMHHGRVHVLSHPRLLIPGTHASDVRTSIDELLGQATESTRPVPDPSLH